MNLPFQPTDWILTPVYFVIILFAALVIRSKQMDQKPWLRFFIPALFVKLLCSIGVGLIYAYYYGDGDTFYYYYDARHLYDTFFQSPSTFFKLMNLSSGQVSLNTYISTTAYTFFRDENGWATDKVFGIISLFSFASYPVMGLWAAVFSFSGSWALFRCFNAQFPRLYKQFAFAILFVPSVVFWGSGVLKDSITFGCLGWLTYSAYKLFFHGKKKWKYVLILLLSAYIILQIKPYILLCFGPALILWLFLFYQTKIRSRFARLLLTPVVIVTCALVGYFLIIQLGNAYQQFSVANIFVTVDNFHLWHTFLAENAGASGYDLGVNSNDWKDILKVLPSAINVTLFRPYLWEAHSIVILVAALESSVLLLFTVFMLFRIGLRSIVKAIAKNSTVCFCLFFSLTFAFSVGFTSYNFGALVRYKIPCIPFFLTALIIIYDYAIQMKKVQKQSWIFEELPSVNQPV